MSESRSLTNLSVEQIAEVCHEANRAYCKVIGSQLLPSWDEAPSWQKNSAFDGVSKVISGEIPDCRSSHENWVEFKKKNGWVYGTEKSEERRTHPCILPYEDLPKSEKVKDTLFLSIIRALQPPLQSPETFAVDQTTEA